MKDIDNIMMFRNLKFCIKLKEGDPDIGDCTCVCISKSTLFPEDCGSASLRNLVNYEFSIFTSMYNSVQREAEVRTLAIPRRGLFGIFKVIE